MRTAKVYARLQSQRSGSARHMQYLLDGHGTNGSLKLWTKGIPKKHANKQDLTAVWRRIDQRWKKVKADGKIGGNSRVTYMQSLIALPNDITDRERHSLAKQILKMFPQQFPVTIVAHEHGSSGIKNKHLHIAFSYRKNGTGKVDREFQQSFEKGIKRLLTVQYKKYGFRVAKNQRKHQVSYKPQSLMRQLLALHGRERMRNPTFLTTVVLPDLKADFGKWRRRFKESGSNKDQAYMETARKAVIWLKVEITKAFDLKQFTIPRISVDDWETVSRANHLWDQPQSIPEPVQVVEPVEQEPSFNLQQIITSVHGMSTVANKPQVGSIVKSSVDKFGNLSTVDAGGKVGGSGATGQFDIPSSKTVNRSSSQPATISRSRSRKL